MYNVQLIHSFHCFEFIELTLNSNARYEYVWSTILYTARAGVLI